LWQKSACWLNRSEVHTAQATEVAQQRRGLPVCPKKRKEPPGNRAAPSSGRIVPTEAKPSELSGCIVGAGEGSVKKKSKKIEAFLNQLFGRLPLE
jgi:hypothetical protein